MNREGLVFLGRRHPSRPPSTSDAYAWQMPQGGIDPGEEPRRRRCANCTRRPTCPRPAARRSAGLVRYDLPAVVAGQAWKGRYRGQTQKWFAFRFEGRRARSTSATRPARKPEFSAWRWERMERLPELIIPFKRPVYERVVAVFGPSPARAD